MCVESESSTTNNFLNTRAKALSYNEFNEPKGSLSIPVPCVVLDARKRAQHVKGVTKDDVKATGKNAEIFSIGKARQEPARRRTPVRRGTGSQA